MLARSARLPWALRGLLAAASVLLAEVALLDQSRGALYATAVMLVLLFALAPGRARSFALLVPVAGAIAAAAPVLLRVGNHLRDAAVIPSHVHSATAAIFISVAAAGAVVAIGAAVEGRAALSRAEVRRLRTATGAVALAALLALIAGGWAAVGDPLARVRHGWDTFKSVRGYAANGSGSRLTSGLGSNRYDFYRVALDEFAAHPVAGIGVDNFQQQYLRHGRSEETPRYPHSVELRTLSQTGVAGALLALAGLASALWAAARAVRPARGGRGLEAEVALAALAGFAYWLVHGSFDWFWEFAGLGAPAFALLGLACALATPNSSAHRGPAMQTRAMRRLLPRRSRRPAARTAAVAAGIALALLAATSLTLPWLSQLEIESAVRIWPRAPRAAYWRLNDAAGLNPLSPAAYLTAGSIAVRFGDLPRADRAFARALGRSPDDAYATLERGAIASSQGRRAAALALLARASHLNPRDPLPREALGVVRSGRRVDVAALNRAIFLRAGHL
jgi:O-antigen ligase